MTTTMVNVLQALAQLGAEFEPMLIGCQENRRNWQMMAAGTTPPDDDDDGNATSLGDRQEPI